MKAPFTVTRESLAGIVKGMNICNRDDVLTVCASGDQAFALLEDAKSVAAVDIDPQQIGYAIERQKALKQGDISKFLSGERMLDGLIGRRNAYFLEKGRLERIKEKIGSLELKAGDLMQMPEERDRFSKIYLSNVLEYVLDETSECKNICLVYLESAAKMLRKPGIICITSIMPHPDAIKEIIPANLVIDEKLTAKARGYDASLFVPTVLRRTA
ncbi:MAG: hypothetical protein WC852_07445 [Candidatus Nanoarchaeia archaeon]